MKITLLAASLFLACAAPALDFGRTMLTGDSLTGGQGITPFSYRYRLHQDLVSNVHTKTFVGNNNWGQFPDASNENKHSGQGGWGVYSLMTGLDPATGLPIGPGKYSDWLAAYDPETVVFFAGGNDFWRFGNAYLTDQTVRDTAMSFYRQWFQQMLNETFAHDANMRLVFGSYTQNDGADPVAKAARNACYADLNSLVFQMGAEQRALGRNVVNVDLFSITDPSFGPFTSDGVHFNQTGADVVGDAIYRGMLETVPEPASMAAVGVLGLACFLKRRRG